MEEYCGKNRRKTIPCTGDRKKNTSSAEICPVVDIVIRPSAPKEKEPPAIQTAPVFKPIRGRDFFYSLLFALLCLVAAVVLSLALHFSLGCSNPNFDLLLAATQILSLWVIIRFVIDKRESGRDAVGLKWPEEPGMWVQATLYYCLFRIAVYFLYFRRAGPSAHLLYTNLTDLLFQLFLLALIAPLFEELVFRGVALAGFTHSYSPGTAVVISSIGFSLMHGQWSTYHFLMGVMFCLIRLKTNSLYCAMLFHGLHNLLVTTFAQAG